MNWNDTNKIDTVEGFIELFAEDVKNDPAATVQQLALELQTLYVRFDNDQEGRGLLGDAGIMGQINGLEAVRAQCIQILKANGEWPLKRS